MRVRRPASGCGPSRPSAGPVPRCLPHARQTDPPHAHRPADRWSPVPSTATARFPASVRRTARNAPDRGRPAARCRGRHSRSLDLAGLQPREQRIEALLVDLEPEVLAEALHVADALDHHVPDLPSGTGLAYAIGDGDRGTVGTADLRI